MRTSRLLKLLLVWIPTQLWLLQAHASLGGTLLAALGAGLVTWGWIVLSARRDATPASPRPPRSYVPASRPERRLERTPHGRPARDVRCPTPRAAPRERR
jgi:hypothetical protein